MINEGVPILGHRRCNPNRRADAAWCQKRRRLLESQLDLDPQQALSTAWTEFRSMSKADKLAAVSQVQEQTEEHAEANSVPPPPNTDVGPDWDWSWDAEQEDFPSRSN